jgi:hydrogenase maturation protease
MAAPRILIAGVGNIFFGDDAFGVEVAQRLARRQWPDGVRVVDFGIRGLDLTYALIDGCDVAIILDAVQRGQAPGTLYVIQPDPASSADAAIAAMGPDDVLIDTHAMDPAKVLRLVTVMGGHLQHILVVGCEPTLIDPTSVDGDADMNMTMSAPVQVAIDEAVALVGSLVDQIHRGEYEPFKEQTVRNFSIDPSLKGDSHHGYHDTTVSIHERNNGPA